MRIAKTLLLTGLIMAGLACGYSHSTTPAAPGTMPNIVQLVPDNANHGSTGMSLTVMGTSFATNATINWKGTALKMNAGGTAGQLSAAIPDADLANAGSASITVTNPGTPGGVYGGGTLPETSNSMTFTIN
jgi:hypothetical protein